MVTRRSLAPLLLVPLGLGGCASVGGGGWESVAYVGDTPPSPEPLPLPEMRRRSLLTLPGLQLRVAIGNQPRERDNQFVLLALPMSLDPRRVYPGLDDPGRTRVFVNATPLDAGFVFRPARAVLRIGERRIGGVAGFVFAQWDRQGRRVEQGGQWDHRRVEPDLLLGEVGRTALLSIDFPSRPPAPDARDVALDLSQALRAPQHPPLPPIRFAPVRWKEGYS